MRILKKKQLEIVLETVPEIARPKLKYEQYTIPAALAATFLWIIAFERNKITGKLVADLGCGTGRLAIGAALLGARHVIGVDIDIDCLKQAAQAVKKLDVSHVIDLLCGDVNRLPLRSKVDVVIQNPPFGVHREGYDREFLDTAFKITREAVYSIHKSVTLDFLSKWASTQGWLLRILYYAKFPIKPIYFFHRKKVHIVDVAFVEFERGKSDEK